MNLAAGDCRSDGPIGGTVTAATVGHAVPAQHFIVVRFPVSLSPFFV